jgi:ElaB/YqjD/DUF883 family membrane-anchored ribosome-binding protein
VVIAPGKEEQSLQENQGMAAIKDARTATHRLIGIVREHPLPALTVGLGLGWLAVEGARGGPLLPLPAKWRRARRRSSGAAAGRRGGLGGLRGAIEERPLAVGVAALAIGLLAGVAMPATRREDELLGDARDELLDSAREAGRDALEKGREVARSAVERVRESVRDQELAPEQLVEKARHVTRDAADTLRDAERQVVHGLGGEVPPAPFEAEPPRPGTPPRL